MTRRVANCLVSEVADELKASGEEAVVEGILVGHDVENVAKEALMYGAERIYHIDDPAFEHYLNRPYTKALTHLVEKYKRIAFPFSTFILTLIGVSLSTKKRRGGTGVNIGVGLALSFIYILFMQVFGELSKAGTMPSMLGVWIPNIIFLIIGLILYLLAPK